MSKYTIEYKDTQSSAKAYSTKNKVTVKDDGIVEYSLEHVEEGYVFTYAVDDDEEINLKIPAQAMYYLSELITILNYENGGRLLGSSRIYKGKPIAKLFEI